MPPSSRPSRVSTLPIMKVSITGGKEIRKALSGDEALLELWNRLEYLDEPRSTSDDRLYD